MGTVIYAESPDKRIQLATQVDAQESATLKYLAEGNANIVYSFKPIANKPLPSGFHHRLLRLRKDKSFIQSTESQAATFQQEFVPLFRPENLIEQTLITVEEALVSRLNQELEEHERNEIRQALRHSDRLAVDGYGLLMTDMTARHGEYLFEIKPKWLLQSPDAPDDAKRCRTCALRLQRAHAMAGGTVMPKPGGFCPLSLIDDDVEERQRAFESIIDAQYKTTIIRVFSGVCKALTFIGPIPVRRVVSYLAEKGYHVLETLRKHQARFDKCGLLNSCSDGVSDDYSKAMTLRDCVLFVKGSIDTFEDTADIRLADLDFKHAHPDKVAKWTSTERTLIDQGWYTKTEINGGADSTCLLTRRSLSTT